MGKFDGITIGGDQSVESFLTDEFTKDVNGAKQEQHYPKKKGRLKYMETKENHGDVTHTPQFRLNQINLEANETRAKTQAQMVVMYLLAGKIMTSKDIVEVGISKHATSASKLLRRIMKSNLSQYMTVEGSKRHGFKYFMTTDGKNLTPEIALTELNTAPYKDRGVKRSTPGISKELMELDVGPLEQPIIKDVVINLTIKLKVEMEY